ncbi:phage major capsid protein [Treponema pectinovorum]|uniref:phage major capsid protein n=1 Tax=Treponema pectinovorum TaxID=164 RepID=UPI0011C98C8E|nr:phage major capsid protein [Treponema pectinovorum]
MDDILTLKNKRATLVEELKNLTEKVAKENRAYSEEENARFDDFDSQIKKLTEEITKIERENIAKGYTQQNPAPDVCNESEKTSLFNVVNVAGKISLKLNDTAMTQADGGAAIAPEQFVTELERDISKLAEVYSRVKKIPVSGAGSLGLPYESADASEAEWTAEVPDSEITEDKTWKFGKRTLTPSDLTKLIKVSKKLLATSAIPIDTLARERIAEKLTAAFENAIINGKGTDGQPLGLFTASDNGIDKKRDVETLQSKQITSDDIMEMYMKLRPGYRRNAVWVLNTAVLKDVMKLKDSNGQYLWHESLRVGEPSTLMGLPVIESEYAPAGSGANGAYSAGDYVIVLGDLSHYQFSYWKGLDITVANEKFAGTNQIGFYGHTLADGCPTLAPAFARLKIKA